MRGNSLALLLVAYLALAKLSVATAPYHAHRQRHLAALVPRRVMSGLESSYPGQQDVPMQRSRVLMNHVESHSCNDTFWPLQRLALQLFYLITGGPDWINNSGWPRITPATQAAIVPITQTDCVRTFNGELGAVTGLSLPHNNLTGSFNRSLDANSTQLNSYNMSVVEILTYLSCNLRAIGLQNNQLSGGLPEDLTRLSQLRTLNLGYNNLVGTLPTTLGNMTAFVLLELTNNRLTGPIPRDLCSGNGRSPLTDLFLGNNQLTGTLDISNCRQLILVDATSNQLSGSLPAIAGYPMLHIVHLSGNNFSGSIPGSRQTVPFSGVLITDLNLATNNLTGSIPSSLADLVYLTNINLRNNNLTGTLPSQLFSFLGTLTSLDASNNVLSGTVPNSIGQAISLNRLDLSNNSLTGVLPQGLVTSMGLPEKSLDLRYNYLSCCGANFSNVTNTYMSYNYSAPLLPRGLSMSTTMRPLASFGAQTYQGLSCPYFKRANQPDKPENLLNWLLDPQYHLFVGCTCAGGYTLTNLSVSGEPMVECQVPVLPSPPWWQRMPYIWVIISLACAVIFVALTWWCMFRRGSRPVMLQNLIDMRKRLRGPPQGGDPVSIVTTDIEGFSALMRRSPELTSEALLTHNSLMRKAKYTNIGFTVEQEGDSYSIAFHEPSDAVKFCLQVQQMLARHEWPCGLFCDKEASAPSSRGTNSTKFKQAGTRLMSGIVQSIASLRRGDAASTQLLNQRPSKDQSKQAGGPPNASSARYSLSQASDMGLLGERGTDLTAVQEGSGAGGDEPQDGSYEGVNGRPSAEGRWSALMEQEGPPRESPQEAAAAAFAMGDTRVLHQRMLARSRTLPAHTTALDGLRVRMGIASGTLPQGATLANSAVLQRAKLVSDAAAGGQVLMCSSTFRGVQHMCEELGCVDHNGTNISRLNAQRAPWWILGAKHRLDKEEAVLLDMGWFVRCVRGTKLPLMLTPLFLAKSRTLPAGVSGSSAAGDPANLAAATQSNTGAAGTGSGGGGGGGGGGTAGAVQEAALASGGPLSQPNAGASSGGAPPAASTTQQDGSAAGGSNRSAGLSSGTPAGVLSAAALGGAGPVPNGPSVPSMHQVNISASTAPTALPSVNAGLPGVNVALDLAAIYRQDMAEDSETALQPSQGLQLYQVLAPSLVARGHLFGSKVMLKDEWQMLDVPYFHAPGSLMAPISSSDVALAGLDLPPVTVVFCQVDGGKQFALRHRRDAHTIHLTLQAVVRSVLRQIPGSYLVKEQDGEFRFMTAFKHPAAALLWCLAVQECAMYVEWPNSALRYWPEEHDGQQLLFRGPRLKMGLCEGPPQSILPDYLGRADYCGNSVNQAARFMDAAAHGGQIACEESLCQHVMSLWRATGESEGPCSRVGSGTPAFRTASACASGADLGQQQLQQQWEETGAGDGQRWPERQGQGLSLRAGAAQPLGAGAGVGAAAGQSPGARDVAAVDWAAAAMQSLPPLPPLPPLPTLGPSRLAYASHAQASPEDRSPFAQHVPLSLQLPPLPLSTGALRQGSGAWNGGYAVTSATAASAKGQLETWLESDEAAELSGRLSGKTNGDGTANGPGPGSGPPSGIGPCAQGQAQGQGQGSTGGPGSRGPSYIGLGASGAGGRMGPGAFGLGSEGLMLGISAGGSVAPLGYTANGVVPGLQMEVLAVRLGIFRFKGSNEELSMVAVTPLALANRRFPRDPPRGKGGRIIEGGGISASASVPVLNVVARYRKEHELLRGGRTALPERTRSLRTPRSAAFYDRSPRAAIRSWASLRGVGQTLAGLRSAPGSGELYLGPGLMLSLGLGGTPSRSPRGGDGGSPASRSSAAPSGQTAVAVAGSELNA